MGSYPPSVDLVSTISHYHETTSEPCSPVVSSYGVAPVLREVVSDALMRPVKLLPRLDAKPWGGQRLADWGIALPSSEPIGEALLTAPEATVAGSEFDGLPLSELAR